MASPPDISRRNPPEEHQELMTNQRVGSTFDYMVNSILFYFIQLNPFQCVIL